VQLVTVYRSLSNPMDVETVAGSKAFAKAVGRPIKVITYNGDSQNELGQLRALLASGNPSCMAISYEPNLDADAVPGVMAVKAAGAFVSTSWGKPASLHPWDVGNNYVSFMGFDGKGGGVIATALFSAMGGHGNIIAINGLPGVPAKQRNEALMKAVADTHGKVKILAQALGNWTRQGAYTAVDDLLTKYGSKINGIWTADSIMGLGALQAVKAHHMTGQIKLATHNGVQQSLLDVKNGGFVADFLIDPYWMGSQSLAVAYCAAIGKIDPSKLPHSQREYYGPGVLITKANVDKYLNRNPMTYANQFKTCTPSKLFANTHPVTYPMS
jgi:ribose transport system substrate-binding protein